MSEKSLNAVKVNKVMIQRHFDGEDFLKTVRKHPYLYDKNQPKFKDTRYKEQQWDKIGAIYSMKGDVCYNKFKNMKDRYTKLLSAVERATARGDAAETIKGIRWRLFPIMHDLLSDTPFARNLPIDLKALFESKSASPSSDNEDDSGSRDELVVKYELAAEEEEDTQDGGGTQQIIITDEDGNQFYPEEEITVVEQDGNQPRFIITGTNNPDEKFTFADETVTVRPLVCNRLKRPAEKQNSENEKLNVNQALTWATQIIEAVESKRQKLTPKSSPEEEEVVHFTSYLKHRLLKYERSRRLQVIHQIETLLYKEEQESQ